MILITGATGFIGRSVVRQLVEGGYDVRVLIRPSKKSPPLPKGIPIDVAVTSLGDARGLRAAMTDVDVVVHLAGDERAGARSDLLAVDIEGTRAVARAAADAGVDRILTVSHLGADRASAFPVLKTKGIAEEALRQSGVDYTILRSAVVFGEGDQFTTGLACLNMAVPYVFPVPGDGATLLQPLWVEDLTTCLVWALDDDGTRNQVFEIGGPEYFSLEEVNRMVLDAIGLTRRILPMRPPYLRWLTVSLEALFPGLPVSTYWIDYLATHRTTGLDTIPRYFGLLPSRFPSTLQYLQKYNWRRVLLRAIWKRQKPGMNGQL